jgi:signal transduction histidine kinase
MSSSRLGHTAGLLLAYATLFVLFDTGATFFEVAPGVSPWYPSAGLNLVLLLLVGPRFAPAVFVMLVASGLFISEPAIPLRHLLLPNLFIAALYAAAAWWLRRRFSARDVLSIRAAVRFCVTALALAGAVAVCAVLSYRWTGLYPAQDPLIPTMLGWWVGDAVGILTVTPLLLVLALSLRPPEALSELEQSLVQFRIQSARALIGFVVEWGVLVAALTVAFFSPLSDQYQFYLCFLPLLWIALRNGLPRTVLVTAFVNVGAAAALLQRGSEADVMQFQFFMLAFSLTGLVLGVLVSERQRSVRALKRAGRALERRLEQYAASLEGPDSSSQRLFSLDWLPFGSPLGTDVLEDSEDVLHRSTENLVALNEQLLRSEQRLQDLNTNKDRFLSIISHDLKTPLFGIRGLTDVLLRQAEDDREEHLLSLIQRSTNQALELLENLLTWARLQTGQMPTEPDVHALRPVVDDCFDLLRSHALQKDVALENSVAPDLEAYVDDFSLDTVLRNLISNGIKFTPAGGYVSVDAERSSGGDEVVVTVSDTGVGISPSRRDSLFQLSPSRSTSGTNDEGGTGLGLHLCKELLDQRGCEIWVDSEVDVGTSVSFTLPTPPDAGPDSNSGPDGSSVAGSAVASE